MFLIQNHHFEDVEFATHVVRQHLLGIHLDSSQFLSTPFQVSTSAGPNATIYKKGVRGLLKSISFHSHNYI